MRSMKTTLFVAAAFFGTSCHCQTIQAQPLPPDLSLLDSTVWAGTAVEHDGLILQAYHQARIMLDRALHDRKWTAAPEQEGRPFRNLPPAIVMDVDETILDNSPFEAHEVVTGGQYDENEWQAWVAKAKAAALPGAVEFTKYARSRGVTVFYVTNRASSQKAATHSNLEADGFPFDSRIDTLYCRGEKPDWGSDKTTRRAEIAARYRILLLFGDDLGDFVSGAVGSLAHRHELMERYRENWGTKWIALPNAMYGSWESALFASASNPDERQKRRLKYDVLLNMQR